MCCEGIGPVESILLTRYATLRMNPNEVLEIWSKLFSKSTYEIPNRGVASFLKILVDLGDFIPLSYICRRL